MDSNYLEQFKLLQKSGVLDSLEMLRKENREFETLINDAAAIFALSGIESMMEFVISRLLDRFIPSHLVFLVESPQDDLLKQYCYRNLTQCSDEFPLAYYAPLKEFFLVNQAPSNFSDMEKQMGPEFFTDAFRKLEPEFIVPMRGIGGLHGLVLFGRKIVDEDYSLAEILYADRFIRFLSIAIQNTLFHESAITDSKTGIYNHPYFMRRLEQEIARIVRHRSRAGIAMLDVDHFKEFNDTWGHLAGDEVLSAIARTLRKTIRIEDVPARFGGDEFIVLLIECDESQLLEAAERVRKAIEELRIPYRDDLLSITVSIGACYLDPIYQYNSSEFVSSADLALYDSKSRGRNRVTLYKPSLFRRAILKRSNET
jgi:two-component system, cell cycle response regulator